MNIPNPSLLAAFFLAASMLTMTPGLDTALVLRTAMADGRTAAFQATLGIAMGCLAWGVLVSVGLGALLHASVWAYILLKFMGAAYLLILGIRLLARPQAMRTNEGDEKPSPTAGSAFREGLGVNLLNPKVGLFYVTFLPQFIPAQVNVAAYTFLLASIHVLLTLAWLGTLIVATRPIMKFLQHPRVARALDRLTGGLFIVVGARLALATD